MKKSIATKWLIRIAVLALNIVGVGYIAFEIWMGDADRCARNVMLELCNAVALVFVWVASGEWQ